jgi:hypothetical protein
VSNNQSECDVVLLHFVPQTALLPQIITPERLAISQLLLQFAPLSALVTGGPVVDVVFLSAVVYLTDLFFLFSLARKLLTDTLDLIHLGLLLNLLLLGKLHHPPQLCHLPRMRKRTYIHLHLLCVKLSKISLKEALTLLLVQWQYLQFINCGSQPRVA